MTTVQTVGKHKATAGAAKLDAPESRRIPFRFHPRALAALGQDLVTNDAVAVMELVKNAYDAMATQVVIRICTSSDLPGGGYIEIADDGDGMDYDTIVNVWSVVATPFRQENSGADVGRSARERTVTGEKGLGRLSAARLGRRLRLTTRVSDGPVLRVAVDWEEARQPAEMNDTSFDLSTVPLSEFEGPHGTVLRIDLLNGTWEADDVEDLREHLARLVSPFAGAEDFRVFLDAGDDGSGSAVEVKAPAFMAEPKYAIKGSVGPDGDMRALYRYRPLDGTTGDVRELLEELCVSTGPDAPLPKCGLFEFEIRAWDLTKDDTRDIANHFRETQSRVRGAVRSHQGVSVYRDDILVLPKSNDARDWLGIDQRGPGMVAPRLTTSQIVGYVRITKADNPEIMDTSDREGLVSNPAATAFRRMILRIIALLESERQVDRIPEVDKAVAADLFADLNTDALVAKLEMIRDEGGVYRDAIIEVRAFGQRMRRSRAAIQRRFGYYSRLAVIGTLSQSLIHQIRNATSVIGSALRRARALADRVQDAATSGSVKRARESALALDRLADRFAPLAHRGYEPDERTTVVEESIDRCLAMFARLTRAHGIAVERPISNSTEVRIDPGELDAVFLNLLTNALYWLRQSHGERRLRFVLTRGPAANRVTVHVDDSGPGIHPDDRNRVFWPGVTRKRGGTGMGLTVASELVQGQGGRITTIVPGRLGGATFEFDLPLAGAFHKSEGDKETHE